MAKKLIERPITATKMEIEPKTSLVLYISIKVKYLPYNTHYTRLFRWKLVIAMKHKSKHIHSHTQKPKGKLSSSSKIQ